MRLAGARPADRIELNMTSAIDLVFLLTIFFMTVIATIPWPTVEASINSYLPKREGAGTKVVEEKEERKNEVQIHLQAGAGNSAVIFFNGMDVGGYSGLRNALRLLQSNAPASKIILAADRDVRYKHVITTLDNCSHYGFHDISFAMKKNV